MHAALDAVLPYTQAMNYGKVIDTLPTHFHLDYYLAARRKNSKAIILFTWASIFFYEDIKKYEPDTARAVHRNLCEHERRLLFAEIHLAFHNEIIDRFPTLIYQDFENLKKIAEGLKTKY